MSKRNKIILPTLSDPTMVMLELAIAAAIFVVGGGSGYAIINTVPAFLAGGALGVAVEFGGRLFALKVFRSEVDGEFTVDDDEDDDNDEDE